MKTISTYISEAIINRDLTPDDIMTNNIITEKVLQKLSINADSIINVNDIPISCYDAEDGYKDLQNLLKSINTFNSDKMFFLINEIIRCILQKYDEIQSIQVYICDIISLGFLIKVKGNGNYVFEARYMPKTDLWRENCYPNNTFNYNDFILNFI